VSAGIIKGEARLDLEYEEDSNADADANFVLTASGGVVEIQATAETDPMKPEEFDALFALARKGIGQLTVLQNAALKTRG